MTLDDMAQMVCGKVRQTDAASLAKCKTYLRARYKMIAQAELWKDLVYAMTFTFDMTSETSGEVFGPNWFSRDAGVWHLPSSVDRVLGLRSSSTGLDVTDNYQFFKTTLDEFADTGDPVKFYVEQRVVADLRGKLAEIEVDGVVLLNGSPDNQAYKVRYIDLDGEQQDFVGNFVAGGGSSAAFYPQMILSATRETGAQSAYFALSGSEIALAAGTRTAWRTYPTIRLVPRPTADVALRALVKRKCIELEADSDAPEINGVDNCLMAFAQVDMYERARQMGKAQLKGQEALALLQQLKLVAVAHESTRMQIVPHVSEVSGAVWDGVGDKGHW